jgi:hypothetical protein
MTSDFVAFRVLVYADSMTTESAKLISECLNWFERHCGMTVREIESCLALYKLKTEVIKDE